MASSRLGWRQRIPERFMRWVASVLNAINTNHRVDDGPSRAQGDGSVRPAALPAQRRAHHARAALERFLGAVPAQDVSAVAAVGGGWREGSIRRRRRVLAASVPLHGARKVVLTFVRLTAQRKAPSMCHEIRLVNGLPALVVEDERSPVRWAALGPAGRDRRRRLIHGRPLGPGQREDEGPAGRRLIALRRQRFTHGVAS